MTEELKEKVKTQAAADEIVWHKPATLGVPSIVYEKSLATVKLAELPLPVELLATTQVSVVGEYFQFIRDNLNIPEAVIINPQPIDESVEAIGSGIARRMQWLTSSIDACTGRYKILETKQHVVKFDENLAVAPHVKMTFRNGRWTAWDWYSSLGTYQPRSGGLPQKMLDKHNSLVAILTGQKIIVPFGLDKGLFDWFQDIFDLTLEEWLINRDEAFEKLSEMNKAYTAGNDAMYRHKHGVAMTEFKGEPGIYEITSPEGRMIGERTFNPEKEKTANAFRVMAANGYAFKLVKPI